MANTLHLSIVRYLKDTYGNSADHAEQLDVALQCLGGLLGVNPASNDVAQAPCLKEVFSQGMGKAAAPVSPPQMDPALEAKFSTFLDVLKSKNYFLGTEPGTPEYQSRFENARKQFLQKFEKAAASPAPTTPVAGTPSAAEIEEAERLKTQGNQKLGAGAFQEAIDFYSKAIALNPNNAIYYCNRAAAETQLGKNEDAIADCKKSIACDAKYIKAYSRLGLAYFNVGKYKEAIDEGYSKALELDPTSGVTREAIEATRAKLGSAGAGAGAAAAGAAPGGAPNLAEMMRNFQGGAATGGAGGAGGAGGMPGMPPGMPDLSSLLSNPAIASMAQNIMSNPQMMNNLMGMFGGAGGAGGAGGLADMMNNPAMADMMNNLRQGGAGGAGGAPDSGNNDQA
eukprot:CAMPEP_0177677064 /NCGR_PEP_ID=MMETSP0447-20121125/28168_1 /TAXON_ID=0 /ORGANISM="Stygamoeba regulata, Strain BSH-02190019" /LENGTH=395 /DNA_ID=CAMNT_0019185759 /DNA_START=27 /DNA_END=1214 /DNA_ORIENTATION=+